jgi:hypothetical protein
MNKAFLKEVEDSGQRNCPKCQTLGVMVLPETLAVHLKDESRRELGPTAYYCNSPTCDVSYFDDFGKSVSVDVLLQPAYPKDTSAPLCRCFNFTWDDLHADLDEKRVTRVRELLAKSQGPAAHCTESMPDGRCCIAEVQKIFLKLRAQG